MSREKEVVVSDHVHIEVNLNAEADAALRRMMAARGIPITEAMRRAVALYCFVEEEDGKESQILIVDKPGWRRLWKKLCGRPVIRELILLPKR